MAGRAAHSSLPTRGTPAPPRRQPGRLCIAAGLADVRREPDAAAEQVTQARLGTPARWLAERDGWVRVRLPDYEGWVRGEQAGQPAPASPRVAVVTSLCAPLYAAATGSEPLDEVHISTVLMLAPRAEQRRERGRIPVRLPGARTGWLDERDVALRGRERALPERGPTAALDLAHALLGVPYLWGGTSPKGVDCSGLAQLAYRVAGCALPRDADQQYAFVPYLVERGDLRPGDLLFFAAGGKIDHVALALGGARLIHATGAVMRVTLNSLDPADSDYSERLARMYAGARRPMPALAGPAGVGYETHAGSAERAQ